MQNHSFVYRHLRPSSRRGVPLARTLGVAAVAAFVTTAPRIAQAQIYTLNTLATFNGADGANPLGNLSMDSNGNLYGTTNASGTQNATIFELANVGTSADPAYSATPDTLVSFTQAQPPGYNPAGGVAIDGQGNLYSVSGNADGSTDVAFVLTNNGTTTDPNYAATTTSLGAIPDSYGNTNTPLANGGLILDSNGNIYGTTGNGTGTVYMVANSGTANNPVYNTPPTTISTLNGAGGPEAGLTMDARGDLFGENFGGGPSGEGSVFEVVNTGSVTHPVYASNPTYLANFGPGVNSNPGSQLTLDSHGNIFGTAHGDVGGYGSVYEIANTGTASNPVYDTPVITIDQFNGTDGGPSSAALTIDSAGNLFGTCFSSGTNGVGTVYKIANTGTASSPTYGAVQTLVTFNGTNGGAPNGALLLGSNGILYGTASGYGANFDGTVFALSPLQNYTWNGAGSDNNWGTNLNWVGENAPGTAAAADIVFDGTTRLNPNLQTPYAVDSVSFAADAGAFTIGGSALTIGANGIQQNSVTNLQTIGNSGVVLGAAQTWNVAAGGLTVSAPVSGGGALTVSGAGTLTLTGNNSYSGGTTVSGGNVQVGGGEANSSSLGTGDVAINNGSTVLFTAASSAGSANIAVNDTSTLTFQNGATAGTSNITVGGSSGSLTFTGMSTAGSSTIINNGSATTVNFVGNSTAGSATIYNESSGGYLQFGGDGDVTAGNANIISTGTILVEGTASLGSATINSSGAYGTIAMSTGSSGATIMNNGGSGVDFGGVDISSAGTSTVSVGSLSGSGNVYLGSATLSLGALNGNDTISGTIADGGAYGGSGGNMTKGGTGTLTLTGANTYTGTTTVNAGNLVINNAAATYGMVISNFLGSVVNLENGYIDNLQSVFYGVTNVYGGTIDLAQEAAFGKINVFGGVINNLVVGDPAAASIYGGQFGFSSGIENFDPSESEIDIYGTDLELTDPTVSGDDVIWMLTGTLQDGEQLDTQYVVSGDDTSSAQGIAFNPSGSAVAPEPGALALLATGMGGLAAAFSRRLKHGRR